MFGRAQSTKVVVHLGNVGMDDAEATRRYVERTLAREIRVIGIDVAGLRSPAVRWEQIKVDFIGGLRGLADDSVDVVLSELALGHYDFVGPWFFFSPVAPLCS